MVVSGQEGMDGQGYANMSAQGWGQDQTPWREPGQVFTLHLISVNSGALTLWFYHFLILLSAIA